MLYGWILYRLVVIVLGPFFCLQKCSTNYVLKEFSASCYFYLFCFRSEFLSIVRDFEKITDYYVASVSVKIMTGFVVDCINMYAGQVICNRILNSLRILMKLNKMKQKM